MPRREDIQSILIIGAGPIIIGQACEFDYSGAQACKALREEGYRGILVNSNPATIRKVVVLPQPDGPSRHSTSPSPTVKSTESTAVSVPKRLVSFFSSIVISLPFQRSHHAKAGSAVGK